MTKRSRTFYTTVGLILVLIWSISPLYWTIMHSFKSDEAIFGETTFLPRISDLTWKSYFDAFNDYPFARYFLNSAIISLGAVILSLFVAIPSAYSFTRLDFPGKNVLFYGVIISVFFPWIALIIPIYDIYTKVGLMDTYQGVIIIYTVVIMPLCLWLLRGFFSQSIDRDLEDAAMVDGCTQLGAFFRVILPLSMPAITAVATFTFLVAWNEFIWVFLLTSGEAKRTAVVGLHYMMGSDVARDWNALLAAMTMTTLPPVIFYAFLQRFITKAFITTGGSKG